MTTPKITKRSFFCHGRFYLDRMETRFGTTEYFVTDAHTVTDAEVRAGKLPETVYQGDYRGALEFIRAAA